MGYVPPDIALFVTPVTFCLPNLSADSPPAGRAGQESNQSRKLTGREPNACLSVDRLPRARLARPSLGKEAIALFFWLVLRTAFYSLIIKILTYRNPIIHVIFKE